MCFFSPSFQKSCAFFANFKRNSHFWAIFREIYAFCLHLTKFSFLFNDSLKKFAFFSAICWRIYFLCPFRNFAYFWDHLTKFHFFAISFGNFAFLGFLMKFTYFQRSFEKIIIFGHFTNFAIFLLRLFDKILITFVVSSRNFKFSHFWRNSRFCLWVHLRKPNYFKFRSLCAKFEFFADFRGNLLFIRDSWINSSEIFWRN